MPAAKQSARKAASKVFSAEEKAAMKELVKERKANLTRAEAAADCLAKIAEMPPSDRRMAERVHKIITTNAPELAPKTWYGMPAYADADGKVVLFFQNSGKFNYRYSTLGFQDAANLDDGDLWPVSYALQNWSAAVEKKVAELVKTAVS